MPRGARQGGLHGGDESGVGIGGHESDARQPAGHQAAEEPQPAGGGLTRADVDAEDLPVPIDVDTGGDHHRHVDHATRLADLPVMAS